MLGVFLLLIEGVVSIVTIGIMIKVLELIIDGKQNK